MCCGRRRPAQGDRVDVVERDVGAVEAVCLVDLCDVLGVREGYVYALFLVSPRLSTKFGKDRLTEYNAAP